jgi:hypothetical protein
MVRSGGGNRDAQTVVELPGVLKTLTGNVDTRRPRHPHGRWDGG